MKLLISCFLFLLVCGNIFAQKKDTKQQGKDYSKYLINPKIFINKDSTSISHFDRIHPHLLESLSTSERDSLEKLIQRRKELYPGDSVTVTEHFYIWKPLIDRLHYEDPHYWVWPLAEYKDKEFKSNDIHVIPVNLLIINDTVIVDKSCDTLFHPGDRVLAVNQEPIENYLNYCPLRYVPFAVLHQFHHFAYSTNYIVDIERKGKKMQIYTQGLGYEDAIYELSKTDWKRELYDEYKIGYMEINAFAPNNSRLIKYLASFIRKVQKAGYKDVIIDVRKNPGGYGHNFDHLISLFTDQDSLNYAREKKIRVSQYTLDYGFPKDSIGKLVDLPEKEAHKKIPLKPKMYLGKMNYYILMSQNTLSMATTFANILQTNKLAKLCGEPLIHNALKYGEVIQVYWGNEYNIELYSTVMIDEFTKNPDGQIYPDIEIPYIAREYMQGGDPVLEKLLNYIKTNKF